MVNERNHVCDRETKMCGFIMEKDGHSRIQDFKAHKVKLKLRPRKDGSQTGTDNWCFDTGKNIHVPADRADFSVYNLIYPGSKVSLAGTSTALMHEEMERFQLNGCIGRRETKRLCACRRVGRPMCGIGTLLAT